MKLKTTLSKCKFFLIKNQGKNKNLPNEQISSKDEAQEEIGLGFQ